MSTRPVGAPLAGHGRWVWLGAWLCLPMLALGLALAARHQWVQAPGMEAWCVAEPSTTTCIGRAWVIQAFLNHRLSTVSLGLAAAAWLLLWRGPTRALLSARWATTGASAMALCGLCVAAAGLVLYDADQSAWAALVCGLGGVHAARVGGRRINDPQGLGGCGR